MASFRLFSSLYLILSRRRVPLFAATALLLVAAGFLFSRTTLEQDIGAMLPDDRSDAARDFALLDRAPFSRKVIISLTAPPGAEGEAPAAADRLAAALTPPLFSKAVTGPGAAASAIPAAFLDLLPELATPADLAALDARLAPGAVRARLEDDFATLLSPEGWVLKEALRRDPLDFGSLALGKARSLNLVPGVRLAQGHFASADGRSALVIADTPVPMTDSRRAREIRDRIEKAVAAAVRPGMEANVVSGHLYTLANAEAIVRDLTLILSLSSLAILAIYIGFLRSWWALFVFLVPMSVLVLAAGWVAAVYSSVFAVTIGFGGVLLGMADEYAMHVYFAIRRNPADAARSLGEVARPVCYGGLATSAAFGVMLTSSLPGQRQLAAFSMAGIIASLFVSLVVLPQLLPAGGRSGRTDLPGFPGLPHPPRKAVTIAWLLLMLVCGWFTFKVRFNGDLGAMNMVPPELRAAENRVRDIWGNPRGKAVLFAEGKTLDEALTRNAAVFEILAAKLPPAQVVSVAQVYPPAGVREANRRRWEDFWRGGREERLRATLAAEGERLGFSEDAFAPFLSSLAGPPAEAGPERLRGAGLGDLLDALILKDGDLWRVLTLVPDTPESAALFTGPAGSPPGVRFVSQTRFRDVVSHAIGREFGRYLALTSLVILLVVTLAFRDWRKVLLSLVPVITGLLFMSGVMGATGLEFNLFNIVACVLIIGLCVDYGIFMVSHVSGEGDLAAARAVLVSGLTTIAGFGVLALARHPALRSIGLTVLLGFGAAIPAALLVIPALHGGRRE